MTTTRAEIARLQRRAERDLIVGYAPQFAIDTAELDALARWSATGATDDDVSRALSARRRDVVDLASLISAAGARRLEDLAAASNRLTRQRFGRTMRMFAPLYLSNECVSECTYCGFQVWNRGIVRRTLRPDQLATEIRYLNHLGFRHVLLVAGEHPKHVSADYVSGCIEIAAAQMPNVSVEVQVWDEATYERFVHAGCDGIVVYQETYDSRVYPRHHLKGNKRFYSWRLGAPERAARAGVRRLGIGALIGLNDDWRWEVLALALHARFLMRAFWRCELTVALPRLERAAGFAEPPAVMTDAELAQSIAALRLVLPDAGIVMSTRERPALRDGLAVLGVTHMSAGSRTEPGGYSAPGDAEPQFEIGDDRPASAVASALAQAGLDPVWKDSSDAFRPI
jgi:2-iminoacetate synthase